MFYTVFWYNLQMIKSADIYLLSKNSWFKRFLSVAAHFFSFFVIHTNALLKIKKAKLWK